MPELRDLQIEGIEFAARAMVKHKAALIADRPGYGKTAQAIEIMKRARPKPDSLPIIVITPAYLVYNWLDEFDLWNLGASVCVVDSTKQIIHEADVYLMSYNMAASEGIFKQLFKLNYSLMICDEAHTFRSWNSIRSSRILGTFKNKKTHLNARAMYKLFLTGTPIVNTVEDVYNLLIRVAPGIFKEISRLEFLQKFAAFVDFTPWGVKSRGVKNEKELKKLLSSVMIARQKLDGLPDRIDSHIRLKLTGAGLQAYLKQEQAFLNAHGINESDIINIQDMRKVDATMFAELRKAVAKYKIPLILPAIVDAIETKERPLVYCWHREIQDLLYSELKKKCPESRIAIVNGSVPTKKRFALVKKYQAGEIDILLSTIGALKEGVNLTEGKILFFVELPYTPAEVEQVAARIHRSGQKDITYIKFFYFAAGIDNHIVKLLKGKSDIIKKVIG